MNQRFQKVMHFLAGIIVVIHGIERMESANGSAKFSLFTGILMLTVALFQDGLEKKYPKLAAIFYWIEGIIIFFIAFELIELFKKYLSLLYLTIGIPYFVTGYMIITKKLKLKKR